MQVVNVMMKHTKTTARGFEPLRAEPNGFLVHHLNHSVTLSLASWYGLLLFRRVYAILAPALETTEVPIKLDAQLARPARNLTYKRKRKLLILSTGCFVL